MANIGSFHAEKGKVYHVHKSSTIKGRNFVEMKIYKIGGEVMKEGKKASYRQDALFCPKCYRVLADW